MGRPILEREEELAELGRAAREALAGSGSIVLIEGEAGIGKTSLVESLRSVLPPEGRLLQGWCDDLGTPRVLGPLRDLREHVGRPLTEALDAGDRGRVAQALRSELDWAGHPTVLVVEDVHWADEATLDVLRLLVRHMSGLPAALVLTYRDELAADHPLRQLLGSVARAPRVRRLRLDRLSRDAVARLASGHALDPDEVYGLTSGNPFLVAEVLTSGDVSRVPPSIAEAVGARLSCLDDASRDAVERLSVVPSAVERWLVEAIVPGGLPALALAEQLGVLTVSPTRVAFRHELTRRAVADSLPAVRRVSSNQAVLAALLDRHGQRGADLSRIMHHAKEAGDDTVIIHYGPMAQTEAAAAGSHREAVAHGRLVLQQAPAFVPEELVEILARHAVECYTVGLGQEAVTAQDQVVLLRRGMGDASALGAALRWLSRMNWWAGHRDQAEECADEAIAVLTGAGDEAALGWALSNRAQLLVLAGRHDETTTVGQQAIALARTLDDPGLLSHALTNVGCAYWDMGQPAGRALLEEGLRVALAAGETEHACRAYTTMCWSLAHDTRIAEAGPLLDEALELAEQADFVGFLRYLHVTGGIIALARGAWDAAEREASWGLDAAPTSRCPALIVTGRARARRGIAGSLALLSEALDLAVHLREAQRLAPACSALLEAAWLDGSAQTLASAADRVRPWHDEVYRHGSVSTAAELGFWLRVAGCDVPIVEASHPYAVLARRDCREAARLWERAGMPYERALALAQSESPADLLEALSILDGIGASPLAGIVRARLRGRGVTRIPRGPAPSTRDNPAGLTDRQVEVLRLLGSGLTNGEIAARLVLSVRTVDTHVAAILGKLGVATRREAARRAADLGICG